MIIVENLENILKIKQKKKKPIISSSRDGHYLNSDVFSPKFFSYAYILFSFKDEIQLLKIYLILYSTIFIIFEISSNDDIHLQNGFDF